MARKTRSDSKLAALDAQQKDLLRTWLIDENLSYQDAKQRLWEDFNVQTSVGALSSFYATECFALRSSEARDFAERVVQELTTSGDKFDEATLRLVRQKAFERAYARNGDLDELATLAKIIGDSQKLKLKQEQLSFSREKFRQQIKTDVEKGLDALYLEIKGNKAAVALYEKLRAVVMKSVDGTAQEAAA